MRKRYVLLVGIVMILIVCTACSIKKQTDQKEESLLLTNQIGSEEVFGNNVLDWNNTTKEELLTYYNLEESELSLSGESILINETGDVSFLDMKVPSKYSTFTYADTSLTQLLKYRFQFYYEEEEQQSKDLQMINEYIEDEFEEAVYSKTASEFLQGAENTQCAIRDYKDDEYWVIEIEIIRLPIKD